MLLKKISGKLGVDTVEEIIENVHQNKKLKTKTLSNNQKKL